MKGKEGETGVLNESPEAKNQYIGLKNAKDEAILDNDKVLWVAEDGKRLLALQRLTEF